MQHHRNHGLTKVFGSNGAAVHALRGIDLTVERGEFVALIGPSGSGKSTLMAILGCLDTPTAGTYALDGDAGRGALGPRARARSATRRSASSSSSTTCCRRPRSSRNVELPMLYAGVAAQGAAARAPSSCSSRSASRRRRRSSRRRSRAASGSASRSRARSPTGRRSSSPTSRPARSTRRPATRSSSSSRSSTARATPSSSSRTTRSIAALAQRQVEIHDGLIVDAGRSRRRDVHRRLPRAPSQLLGRDAGEPHPLDPPVARRHPRRRRRCSAASRSPTACGRRSIELYVKMGGLDKLNVQPSAVVKDGAPTALQMANLGLRSADADEGQDLDTSTVDGVSLQQGRPGARALPVRRPGARDPRHRRRLPGPRRLRGRPGPRVHRPRPRRGGAGRDPRHRGRVASSSPTATPSDERCASATRPCRSSASRRRGSSASAKSNRNMFRWRNRIIALPDDARGAPLRGGPVPPRGPRDVPHPRPRRDGEVHQGALLAAEGEPPPAGGLPPRRRRGPRAQGAVARATSTTSSSCCRGSCR